MALWLKALAPLPEDLSTVPTWQFTIVSNSSSRGSSTLYWLLWALYECGIQTYIQANTHTHKMIIK